MDSSSLDAFRSETRAWLETHCPASMRQSMQSEEDTCWGGRRFVFASDAQQQWMQSMAAKGWTVPTWPVAYGGAGLDAAQARVLSEEMRRLNCRPPLHSFGIWMLGPALLKFGSEEQKLRFLPPIARGEIRWCQGYSEPNAGSDLASLQTRAEDKGDHFLVNGQKIWTSYADQADWIFCLVRTQNTGKKHEGISFVLFDMTTPGVSTKPIRLISGKSPFCETFFDDVRVEKSNLVGDLGKGWDVAKYLLAHEREMISSIGDRGVARPIGQVIADASGRNEQGQMKDSMLRSAVAELEVDEYAFRLMQARFLERWKLGQANPAYSSALKYYGSELNKRRQECLVSGQGSNALEIGPSAQHWLRSKGNSIEGGTSEVQLGIIAKRILDLPGA
jgi:acyl-CoA dehydrogenase